MKREIEAPATDWLTEEEAVQYLRLNGPVFRQLWDAGHVPGVRRLSRQLVLFHWKGLVCLKWRLELGDVPTLDDEHPQKAGESRGKSRKADESDV